MNAKPEPGIHLNLARLKEGLNRLSREVAASELELRWPEVEFSQPVVLALDVLRMGDGLQVDGRFESVMRTACDRCLTEVTQTIRGSFRTLVREGDPATHELAGQDGVVFHDGHTIDLTGEVREAVLLEVPVQNVCSPACRGLCPQCGADRNRETCACAAEAVDPRWAALERLKAPRVQG